MIVLGTSRTTPAPELITIDRGALYLVRPESIKGSRECMCVSIVLLSASHSFE